MDVVGLLERLNRLEARVVELETERDELRARVQKLEHENRRLKNENAELRAQFSRTSGNSHQPPSSDRSWNKGKKQPTGKKPGGQLGHKGHFRKVEPEHIDEVRKHYPHECEGCGAGLGLHSESHRVHHQWEIPEPKAHVIEHRYERVRCSRCGTLNEAKAKRAERSCFGPGLIGQLGHFQSGYGLSRQDCAELAQELYGVDISAASISNQRKVLGAALCEPVEQAQIALEKAALSGMDETSHRMKQGRGFLWVRTSEWLTVFLLHLRRSRLAARRLLAELEDGQVLVTDRYGVYLHLPAHQHQLCWAHLHREFIGWQEHEHPGTCWLGHRLGEDTEAVFAIVKKIRDGTVQKERGHPQLRWIEARMRFRLRLALRCSRKKTQGKAKHILKYFERYWTFMHHEGVHLTNNDSERALRHAVIWRKTSFGVQSAYGALFVSTMLSVRHSLRSQKRSVRDFIHQALSAYLHGMAPPSLLPTEKRLAAV